MNELGPIIVAIKKEHDVNTTPKERLQAQQICTEFKDHPRASWFAFHLMHRSNEPIIRHFGEQVIEYVVRYKWNTLPPYTKIEIRNSLLGFLKAGTKDILEEQLYIKEKIATVIVEIAKRDWQRTWKTLQQDMEEIAKCGEKQTELVLIVYRTLAQEIHNFNQDIPKNTVRLLASSLNEISGTVMKFFYDVLEVVYRSYKGSTDPKGVLRELKLIMAVLQAVQAFVEWVPLKILHDLNFWAVLCILLQEIPLRVVVCECLILLLDRKEKPDDHMLLFPFEYMPNILPTISIKGQNFSENYLYEKRLCQFLTMVGLKHLTLIPTLPPKTQLPPHYQMFLDLMLQVTSHASLKLNTFCFPFWINFLKNNTMMKYGWTGKLCERLLHCLEGKVVRVKFSEGKVPPEPIVAYVAVDFENDREFTKFFANYRNQLVDIFRKIGNIFPEILLQYLEAHLQRVIAIVQHDPSGSKSLNEFEGVCKEIDAIVPSVLHTNPSGYVVTAVERILKMVFDFNHTDPLFTYEQLEALTSFGSYYQINPSSVEYILTRVIHQLTFMKEGEISVGNLSKSTLNTRRKAAESLLKLCYSMNSKLLPYLGQMSNIAQQLLNSDKLLLSEQIPLTKSLVIISNNMKNCATQKAFLSELVSNIKNQWISSETTKILKDLSLFLPFIGIDTTDDPWQVEQRRNKLYSLLHNIYVIWKNTRIPEDPYERNMGGYQVVLFGRNEVVHPLVEHDIGILPNIFNLVQLLHQIWTPPFRLKLSENWKMLYMVDEITLIALLDPLKTLNHIEYYNVEPQNAERTKFLRNLLVNIREWCYELVGLTTQHGPGGLYSFPDLPGALLRSVFSHLTYIENSHLVFLIRHVITPLMVHLPLSSFEHVIPVFYQVCMTISGKIVREWAEYKEVVRKVGDIDMYDPQIRHQLLNSDELQEIIKEKMLRDASRTYAHLVLTVLLQDQGTTHELTPTCNYLKVHQESFLTLLQSMIHLLGIEDGPVVLKCITFFTWILPILLPLPDEFDLSIPPPILPPFLGMLQRLMKALLVILTWERLDEQHNCVLYLICLVWKLTTVRGVSIVMDMLRTMPNVDLKEFMHFEQNFKKVQFDKEKKVLLKNFFTNQVGLVIGENIKKKSNILEIPDSYFANRVVKKKEDEDLPLEFIAQLFDRLGEA